MCDELLVLNLQINYDSNKTGLNKMVVNFVVVDDEKDWLDICTSLLETSLTGTDLSIKTFQKTSDAFDYIIENQEIVDIVISDYLIPDDINGLDLYYKLTEKMEKEVKFILISNSKIPRERIKELVIKKIVYLPKSFLVVKNFVKKHLEDIIEGNL